MKKSHLLLAITLLFSVCGHLKAQTANPFSDQFTFEKFVELLKNPYEGEAQQCGLTPIYFYVIEQSEEDEVGGSSSVYGWGVEKGRKLEYGYELKCTSPHACYFYYQEDTSRQAAMCFKDKDDADRFFEEALEYGLVVMGNSYHVATEKLPGGTVTVVSFSDYNIMAEITKPANNNEFHPGFYVISIYFFA